MPAPTTILIIVPYIKVQLQFPKDLIIIFGSNFIYLYFSNKKKLL